MKPSTTPDSRITPAPPVAAYYRTVLLDNITLLLTRFERDPHAAFVDTKLDLMTGRDFAVPGSGSIYGRDVVYAWIQGRGIEALAGHLTWIETLEALPPEDRRNLVARGEAMLERVVDAMERLCQRNGGRVCFMMNRDGTPLEMADDGTLRPGKIADSANFSDIFYAKGLFAAAQRLGHVELAATAEARFRRIIDHVLAGDFITDQQPMDPRNRVAHVPGRVSHGPLMIALGGVALLIEKRREATWARTGAELLARIVERHVNHGQFPRLAPGDFVEFLTPDGQPYIGEDRSILCDPGHGLELIGLGCKVLIASRRAGLADHALAKAENTCRDTFPALLQHLFELGFNRRHGGICKAYDLAARRVLNGDMPWWSLPETMRAASVLPLLFPSLDRTPFDAIFNACHEAFATHYVNPAVHHMAVQTRNADGHIVPVIPAVPDADPCYHTGLSIIDALGA